MWGPYIYILFNALINYSTHVRLRGVLILMPNKMMYVLKVVKLITKWFLIIMFCSLSFLYRVSHILDYIPKWEFVIFFLFFFLVRIYKFLIAINRHELAIQWPSLRASDHKIKRRESSLYLLGHMFGKCLVIRKVWHEQWLINYMQLLNYINLLKF